MTRRPPTTETRIVLRTILSAGVLVLLVLACAGTAAGATWVVDGDGGADFTSIQAAVDAASDGDTIEVRGGTYIENVDVDKRVTLRGEGADVVTVRAADAADHVFEATADWVAISGFTATGATDWYADKAGIYLYNADHCSIYDNIASNNKYGIHLFSSSNNNIANNTANSNTHDGIRLRYSSSNELTNNTANSDTYCGIYLHQSSNNNIANNTANSNSVNGIYLHYSSNNTLMGNIMSGNAYNFRVYGESLSRYIQNIDISNRVNGKPVYYWVNQQNRQIPNDAGFVGIVNSTNITIRDLTLTNNGEGVLLVCTNDSRIEHIITSNNEDGIHLYSSNNNNIINNTANSNSNSGIQLRFSSNNNITNTENSNNYCCIRLYSSSNNNIANNTANSSKHGFGIYLSYSSDNTLQNNNITSNNRYGIYLFSSGSNALYHNNLNNTQNAYDTGTNTWDSGSEGNHYSDYTGTDSDGDGIGDTPYPIPGGSSVDRYPLMAPYTPPTGPQDRSLVQVEGESEVYWFQNGRHYWVTDWNVINDMSGVPGWDSVNTLPASKFNPAGYPQGSRFITTGAESDGLLIREQGHPEVYLISGGEKHHFTSPEALLWNGHSFDDVIDVSAAIIGMFPSGSDISITQAIINKYNDLGGEATFGAPAGTGEQSGYPDSSGVVCSYVNFQNGAIECFTSGDYAGNAYAILNPFFDKWASMGYGKSVLGYPVSDMSDVQTSSFGTLSRYQKFINGTEEGSLEYNLTSGDVFEIHGAIYAKWSAMGYSNSILGLVTSDEREAVPSFKGTTGRVSDFENGHLHWHSSGEYEGVTYTTYGELDDLYTSMGGTACWLGFPVMDQEERDGHGYCEFEGGYIEWGVVSGAYKALPYDFSVEITSPENDDVFSKKSGVITFRAEVSGGTPEFTYTWLLDGRTQVENTNERYSEWTLPGSILGGGEHRVNLRVEDAQDNTAESNEVEFKVFDKLLAIIPIEFDDLPPQVTNEVLTKKADYVVSYYKQQSYNKEDIGYKLFGKYDFSEKYEDVKNGIYKNEYNAFKDLTCPIGNDWYVWTVAIENAGMTIEYEKINDCEPNVGSIKPVGYDVAMVVFPEIKSPEYPRAITSGGAAWVDAQRGYGAWAHELGHALYGYGDLAPHSEAEMEAGHSDIRYWGLMSIGWSTNPPSPITLFDKNESEWIEWNTKSSNEYGTYSIKNINDPKIVDEGALRYKAKSGEAEYYVFEGRYPTDGVSSEDDRDKNIKLEEEEGIMIYQVYAGKIFNIPKSCGLNPFCLFSDLDNRVTMLPGDATYIADDEVKLTALKENNELKIKIEEHIPYSKMIWNMAVFGTPSMEGVPATPEYSNLDVDLHVVSSDGKKIGMDYSTGIYYNEIEVAHTNGNIPSGGYEWISVPMNIGAEAYVDLTPELKELLRNNDSINVEVISTFITYDGNGNRIESNPLTVNINSENVGSPLILSLPINITFLPPITTMEHFNLTDGRTIPIKFTARNSSTNEFIYDDTVNVTITNTTGHLIAFFTNGTGTDSVRINSTEEHYIVNFHTKDYDLNVEETYTIHVTFGEADTLRGYAITHFTLVDRKH